MSNTDVERTLKEIRDRARMQMQKRLTDPRLQSVGLTKLDEKALESLKAYLLVLERSWSRLPPLTSYRRGWLANLELWCKRLFKRATHWFTIEQVNFNSATFNFLQDVLVVLSAHDEMLTKLKAQQEEQNSNTANLHSELQSLPAKLQQEGKSFEAPAASSSSTVSRFIEDKSTTNRRELIEAEIDSLTRRIEELRSRKSRLD